MNKKILGICAALVAFAAFAIAPAMASASPELTENGETLKSGAGITATNTGTTEFSAGSFFTIKCNNDHMAGTLATNSGTLIEGNITSASFKGPETGEKCEGGSFFGGGTQVTVSMAAATNSAWCITSGSKDTWSIAPHECGKTGGEFTFTLTGSLECKYKRSTAITGTFTTNSTPATLTMSGEPEFSSDGGSGFCPSSGKLKSMVFDLYTTGGTTGLTIS